MICGPKSAYIFYRDIWISLFQALGNSGSQKDVNVIVFSWHEYIISFAWTVFLRRLGKSDHKIRIGNAAVYNTPVKFLSVYAYRSWGKKQLTIGPKI